MNDRFKFRAWNKEESIMHYNAEYAYDSMGGKPALMHDSFGGVLDDDNLVVEQCTGLRDKNSKLIYEGDVVKTVTGAIGEVVWMNCGFWVNFPAGYCCGVCVTQEIIGNIHKMVVAE